MDKEDRALDRWLFALLVPVGGALAFIGALGLLNPTDGPVRNALFGGLVVCLGLALIATGGLSVATFRFYASLAPDPKKLTWGWFFGANLVSRRRLITTYSIAFGVSALFVGAYIGLPQQQPWIWRLYVVGVAIGAVGLSIRNHRKAASHRHRRAHRKPHPPAAPGTSP